MGKQIPGIGYSGFNEYIKVKFDLERLKEFDPGGTAGYLEQHPEVQKETDIKKKSRTTKRDKER